MSNVETTINISCPCGGTLNVSGYGPQVCPLAEEFQAQHAHCPAETRDELPPGVLLERANDD